MQAAQTYDDWYRILPTAGALAHFLQDMHQPMHLTQYYNGNPSSGLHAKYEGGQFEDGTVSRYPELRAAITPVAPVSYGNGPGFINALFNRIPTDYNKNVLINNANTVANAAGSGAVYFDTLWGNTKTFTKDSFNHSAGVIASAFYTAYVNAGSPAIPEATFFATSAAENSTITTSGPITDYTNQDFFYVRGGSLLGRYGVVRFDMRKSRRSSTRFMARTAGRLTMSLALESNSSSSGSLKVFYSQDDTTNIQAGSRSLRRQRCAARDQYRQPTPLLQFAVPSKPTFTITALTRLRRKSSTGRPCKTTFSTARRSHWVVAREHPAVSPITTGARTFAGSLRACDGAGTIKPWPGGDCRCESDAAQLAGVEETLAGSCLVAGVLAVAHAAHAGRGWFAFRGEARFGFGFVELEFLCAVVIEKEHLLEVIDDALVIEDEARVAVGEEAVAGPIVAADGNADVVNDDSLGVRVPQLTHVGSLMFISFISLIVLAAPWSARSS